MSALPITSLFATPAAIALILLSFPVTLRPIKVGVAIGPGDDETLTRRIRAQGNFTEYVPLALLLMTMAELRGAAGWLLVATGSSIAIGRALHAGGTLRGSTPLRGAGMIFTYLGLLAGGGAVLTTGLS